MTVLVVYKAADGSYGAFRSLGGDASLALLLGEVVFEVRADEPHEATVLARAEADKRGLGHIENLN